MQYKKLKIKKKKSLGLNKVVDLTVKDTSNYVSKNGIINHNSGIKFSGSITLNLASVAKLDDKDNNKAAEKNLGAGNLKKNGVLVTAWPDKSRFCIPHRVKFQIPYFKKPNPYIGLEEYLNWDNAGIMQGKCLTEDEFQKLKPNEQLECVKFDFNGENRYAWPKKTMVRGVGLVCKHLGRQVTLQEFYSPVCFTEEYMKYVNENIIHPLFELPSQDSFDDITEIERDLGLADDGANPVEDSTEVAVGQDLISTDMGV